MKTASGRELARLDACEVIESPMATEITYPRAAALAHVAELLDELLPDREANDADFPAHVVGAVGSCADGEIWMPVTYFELWLTRLVGLSARSFRVHGMWQAAEREPGFFSRVSGWSDVRRRQAAGVVGDFERIPRAGGADVPSSGGKLCGRSLAQGHRPPTCESF